MSKAHKNPADTDRVVHSDDEWRRLLTPEQFHVAREAGTERAFTGAHWNNHEAGMYLCVCCGQPLYSSDAKFDSGTGWPSFAEPVAEANIRTVGDTSHGTIRTEARCPRCDAHLGHVFDDGPAPTGQRHCINSASLRFVPRGEEQPPRTPEERMEKATFGAGCFWGVEAAFRQVKGVLSTAVGYTGGTLPNPTYRDVCTDKTGHAEVVEVTYDPTKVSYEDLLEVFWSNHDPTTLNRQGPDVGTQYRSVIFYHTPEQRDAAIASKARLQSSGRFKRPIVTEITPASQFHPAEEYHQRYLEKRGLSSCHLA